MNCRSWLIASRERGIEGRLWKGLRNLREQGMAAEIGTGMDAENGNLRVNQRSYFGSEE